MRFIILKVANEVERWLTFFLSVFPGRLGVVLRRIYYGRRMKCVGKRFTVELFVEITNPASITVGDDVYISSGSKLHAALGGSIKFGNNVSTNSNVMINARGDGIIEIGDSVLIGPNVVVRACNHDYRDATIPVRMQGMIPGVIYISEDVWIAANAVILPNVNVGRGAIVAAGAVVTKDVGEYLIIGGVPGRCIGSRKSCGVEE